MIFMINALEGEVKGHSNGHINLVEVREWPIENDPRSEAGWGDLALDRLTAQGPYHVRDITDKFEILHGGRIRRRAARTSYLDDGYEEHDTIPVVRDRRTITPSTFDGSVVLRRPAFLHSTSQVSFGPRRPRISDLVPRGELPR
jgi:hypothetical protein